MRIDALVVLILLIASSDATKTCRQTAEPIVTGSTVKTFIAGEGDWNDPCNWFPPGVPMDGDHAVIPDKSTCHVRIQDAIADSFEVQMGGILFIHGQLTIDRDSSVEHIARVRLARDFPTDLPTLVIDGDVVVTGSGSITGEYHLARIIISHGCRFANETQISGVMRIVGSPTVNLLDFGNRGRLLNGGSVQADNDGTLALESSIRVVNHATSGEWTVSNPDARLHFETGAGNLNDDFVILSGELQIDDPITTSGNLTLEAGFLDINANLTLHHPDYPESKSLFTFNGGSGDVACEVIFSYDDFAGTQPNPDNTKDEDPPYEVVGPPCGG